MPKIGSGSSRVSPAQEYDSLREELNQSKKYVFERPLLIVGVGAALLTAEGFKVGAALPAVFAGLLLFNYWFTVNRLSSAARIVAYIQLVLEGDIEWIGWETSLREYRMWIKENKKAKKKKVEDAMNKKAIPDALMYYPPIYQIHIAFIGLCSIAGIILTYHQPDHVNCVSLIVIVALSGVFVFYCIKWRPGIMRSLIERNIVIWEYVFGIRKWP